MKKQIPSPIRAHLLRGAFYGLLVLPTVCIIQFALAQRSTPKQSTGEHGSASLTLASHRTLTFDERVAYQQAIEGVYWRHRIWPKDNPESKPSLDDMVSQAQLEKKVEAYLCKSGMVADQRGWPITALDLQAEMDRMAQRTRQPEVLRELFDALKNDSFVIAECLARPLAAERLLARSATEQVKQTIGTYEQVAAATGDYRLPSLSNQSGCIDDNWTTTSTTNAPDARESHTVVWTGSEMIVWGGIGIDFFNTGGRYDPATDTWTATSTQNAPDARLSQGAVWTGSEMIIWGGFNNSGQIGTGGRYNPITDTWTATSTTNAPSAREYPTAVWTGSEMIVWAGFDNMPRYTNTGGRYNPSTDSWIATSTANAPSPRARHTAVWTDSEMIVWGGYDDGPGFNTGGKYNPNTDSWTATSTTNAPDARASHTAVWTGNEMIIWGGSGNTGGKYDPSTDKWTATSTTNAPDPRGDHTAVWSGTEMIVWGGSFYNGFFFFLNTGGRYNPSADSWTATSTINVPDARALHSAVWSGTEMIVWGGSVYIEPQVFYFNTGGRYCAESSPTPTPTSSVTPTATPTPTVTPAPTATATAPATATPTPRVTPRPRPTPHPRPTL